MFNIDFLHKIRDHEIRNIIKYFPPNGNILEIGGGTGYQAKKLSEYGFTVTSIDLPNSYYKEQKEFPVIEYDGKNFPFMDNKFDVVFSSNVLEHILDLNQVHIETKRVLKPNGYCIHVLPSGSWRFWTNIAHYIEYFQKISLAFWEKFLNPKSSYTTKSFFRHLLSTTKHYLYIPRHGEKYNAIIEIFTFSKWYWIPNFKKYNMSVEMVAPIGLFYTGHMIFSKKIPIIFRTKLAKLLGSACVIYKLTICP